VNARTYGTIGIVGIVLFLVANLAMHFLNTDLSLVENYLSDYAVFEHGWVSRLGDFASAVGIIAIGLGLKETLEPGKRVTVTWMLFIIAGLGFVMSGIWVTDVDPSVETTTHGALHTVGGIASILSLMFAVWFLRGVFRRDDGYRYLARTQHWFAVVITVLLVPGMAAFGQRAFVIAMGAWWLVLAVNIRRFDTDERVSVQAEPA
jgi:hypothetical membrane protein